MNRRWKTQVERGFTLLELLVVVAIIAILAAVVIANLNSARAKAYDSRVRTDLDAASKAIQVYTASVDDFDDVNTQSSPDAGLATLNVLVPTYLGKLPTHPVSGKTYTYISADANTDGVLDYVLYGPLSTGSDSGKCFVVKNGSSFVGGCSGDDIDLTK